jgi:hypothetical protein
MDTSVKKTAPITDQELAEALRIAPLANLNGKAQSPEALALVRSLAERYPRLPSKTASSGKPYKQVKTKEGYEAAVAAFLADLLSVYGSKLDTDWIRVSLNKGDFTDQPVSSRQFANVRKAWNAEGLVDTKPGFSRRSSFEVVEC